MKVCIATDNGRTKEFIKRKVYKDKSQCYECGEGGHLSYKCPKNQLGDREKPVKKKRKKSDGEREKAVEEVEEEVLEEEGDNFGLGDAIRYVHACTCKGMLITRGPCRMCQEVREAELRESAPTHTLPSSQLGAKRKTIQPSSYFSDEDVSD